MKPVQVEILATFLLKPILDTNLPAITKPAGKIPSPDPDEATLLGSASGHPFVTSQGVSTSHLMLEHFGGSKQWLLIEGCEQRANYAFSWTHGETEWIMCTEVQDVKEHRVETSMLWKHQTVQRKCRNVMQKTSGLKILSLLLPSLSSTAFMCRGWSVYKLFLLLLLLLF